MFLLDTCILLWALEGNQKKLGSYYEILENPDHCCIFSVVSYWEIVIKKSLGKLSTPDDLLDVLDESGFERLNLSFQHIQCLETLPMLHPDPFDRLLVAQAKAEGLKLLSTDSAVLAYF